jgi:translation initiation factor 3 subunit L
MLGLLRVHCLLGDYHLALTAVKNVDLNRKGLFTRVTACHISVYYYVGFAYMMMRRYNDAVRVFTNVLLFISRTKQYHTRSYQYDQILKRNEHMMALLAMCLSLSPQRIDENVHTALREKYTEKMYRMQKSDDAEACFEELFITSCPKFVNVTVPDYDDPTAVPEAYRHQLKVFLAEVKQQMLLPTIRSYLKLYTTISIAKLAQFLEMEPDVLKTHLLCLKHKSRQVTCSGGDPLAGRAINASETDFYLDNDMVTVSDTKVARRYGEYFIRHITKFEEIIKDLERPAAPMA